jgi:serine/threonine-protein kinase
MSFEAFVLKLKELSEGNFMYLRHVLPAIELGSFREGGVDELPRGLLGYYRQHWEQMRGDDAATFARNKKVIAVLATARQPASPAFVSRITGLSLEDVQWTLEKWREFLHPSSTDGELRFRIYHASYRDFLARQAGG